MRRAAINLAIFVLALLLGGQLLANEPNDRFEEQWSNRESDARDAASRAELAKDLADAAKIESDEAYRVILCERAHHWGSQQLEGYAAAASALDLLQRTDPSRRLWCLQELSQLYARAFSYRPQKLRLGTGLAEVLGEIAEQRAQTFAAQFDAGESSVAQTASAYRASVADFQEAANALDKVIKRAQRDARAVQRQNPALSRSLDEFAREFTPAYEQMIERRKQVSALHSSLLRLQAAQQRFERNPDSAGATYLAAMYIVDLDRPELVGAEARKLLADDIRQPLNLADSDPAALKEPQADMLSRWYVELANTATDPSAKSNMLIRALFYRQLADAKKFENPASTAAALRQSLADLKIPTDQADRLLNDLRLRLNYQYDSSLPQAIASADGPQTRIDEPITHQPQVDPDPPVESPSQPQPDPQPEPQIDPQPVQSTTTVTVTTTRASHTGGRPMVVCKSCGRSFFPGWGVGADTCERCSHGGGNLFDLGKD